MGEKRPECFGLHRVIVVYDSSNFGLQEIEGFDGNRVLAHFPESWGAAMSTTSFAMSIIHLLLLSDSKNSSPNDVFRSSPIGIQILSCRLELLTGRFTVSVSSPRDQLTFALSLPLRQHHFQ